MQDRKQRASWRTGLACIWALFLARGLFYISFVPIFEGFDEWSHYAVVQNIALGGPLLPRIDDKVSLEVQAAIDLAPTPPLVHATSHDAWWKLPVEERQGRQRKLQSLPADWARTPANEGARAYEGQQAPAYYWLLAPVYRLGANLPLPTRVWLLRLLSLTLASGIIPLGFFTARKIFRDDGLALGAAALTAAFPELMMTVGHIGNDSLAVPAGALFVLALLWWKEEPGSMARAIALGSSLGLALLTKAYFLALLPPLIVFAGFIARRDRRYRPVLAVFGTALVIAGWWYGRNWMLGQSLSGEQLETAARGAPSAVSIGGMNWLRAADFTFLSHIWLGNWSFLVLRSWMYRFFALAAGLAAAGLGVRMVRRPNSDLWLLCGLYLSFVAGMAYHALRTFQVQGFPGALGYYLFAIVIVESVLAIIGLQAILPSGWAHAIAPAGILCFAALECFGMFFYSIPYYTGFIARLPTGALPAFRMAQWRDGGLATMLDRLAVNKPAFLNPAAMGALWILFVAGTLGLVAAPLLFHCTRNNR